MFKNKIVLLLFVIYITIAFAVPTNIVEYNNSEVSINDAYTVNTQSLQLFPGGHMNADILYNYIKKFLPNIGEGITPEKCEDFVQIYAISNPDKGLTIDEYANVNSIILRWIHEPIQNRLDIE
ncbi:uncharacterized protein LOC126901563 isoform X1 [Daktulosphaira vitifoliae]|uniref:uncharacterized protein LOC126901563 isoform X1 n=1 Tax=Daktulosphaira vitifoliae TaxID=58002 RepID=UPI0021AA8F81|nr:uncharacterized protein LOC126901563 isoform X1 [Daktulosphaira vitifoliae]